MGKKKTSGRHHQQHPVAAGKESLSPTIKDMLSAEMVSRLKAQAEDMRAAEARQREEERRQAEEKRRQEQKQLENDFSYLLSQSDMDWRKHK